MEMIFVFLWDEKLVLDLPAAGENFGGDFNGCCYFKTNIEHNSPKYTHHSTQITKECDYSNKIMLNSGVSRIFLLYSARSSTKTSIV